MLVTTKSNYLHQNKCIKVQRIIVKEQILKQISD